MDRRGFLATLSAVPGLSFLKPKSRNVLEPSSEMPTCCPMGVCVMPWGYEIFYKRSDGTWARWDSKAQPGSGT